MTTSKNEIDWTALDRLVQDLEQPETDAARQPHSQLQQIEQAIEKALAVHDWAAIVRIRNMFTFLLATDSITGHPIVQRLEIEAIRAAENADLKHDLAHFLGARGHNLHRLGYHKDAIDAFRRSEVLYKELGENFPALKSYYMTALCWRALGDRAKSLEILNDVLKLVDPQNPWRGNPLQVQAWLLQDEGNLSEAEGSLQEALLLQRQANDGDILVAGTLADLGEIVGLQNRYEEAEEFFQESLKLIRSHRGQYLRQEARTLLKFSELLIRKNNYDQALKFLAEAAMFASGTGQYYDLLWRIELARCLVFLKIGRYGNALAKLRVAFRYRRKLSLSNWLLFRQLLQRWMQRSGLPR